MPKPGGPEDALVQKLRVEVERIISEAAQLELTPRKMAKFNREILRAANDLNGLLTSLDPIEDPGSVLDPGNPRTIGFFVGLAMAAQPRRPLDKLRPFYGAGIYAVYYTGDFELYKPISRTETPVYIGMAVQGSRSSSRPLSQGTPLASRLEEHRKNIARATESIFLSDFEYRALVVQSGWEYAAENYLIDLFSPIWNKETNIIYGFGKHGDSIETRKNRRSPWDTLHAGRSWASVGEQTDAKSEEVILEQLKAHFAKTPIFKNFDEVLAACGASS
jgi:hypothetical protein